MNSRYELQPQDYFDDAKRIGCDLALILAVFQVESAGKGFYEDGTPKTLFEGHIFYRLTKGKFAGSHPTLCYPKWTKEFYGKNEAEERKRLELAAALDRDAALMSCSWGLPQIMGFNFSLAGFSSLQAFINAMYKSANSQLECFTNFIMISNLDDELRERRLEDFVRQYNGSGQVEWYLDKILKAETRVRAVHGDILKKYDEWLAEQNKVA